jgi:hypothetical protein
MEFGKKMSVEKELSRLGAIKFNNLVYDESGNFLIYSSLLGIKFVNLATQKVSRLIGQREHLRCLFFLILCFFSKRPIPQLLRIRDILVRIRIRASVHLTNGFGSRSGCYFVTNLQDGN